MKMKLEDRERFNRITKEGRNREKKGLSIFSLTYTELRELEEERIVAIAKAVIEGELAEEKRQEHEKLEKCRLEGKLLKKSYNGTEQEKKRHEIKKRYEEFRRRALFKETKNLTDKELGGLFGIIDYLFLNVSADFYNSRTKKVEFSGKELTEEYLIGIFSKTKEKMGAFLKENPAIFDSPNIRKISQSLHWILAKQYNHIVSTENCRLMGYEHHEHVADALALLTSYLPLTARLKTNLNNIIKEGIESRVPMEKGGRVKEIYRVAFGDYESMKDIIKF